MALDDVLPAVTVWLVVFARRTVLPDAFCTWKAAVELLVPLTNTPVLLEPLAVRFMLPVPPWIVVVLVPICEPMFTVLVELAVPLLPRFMVWATAPVVLPIWIVSAIPPVPKVIPAVPDCKLRDVAPVELPIARVWATALLPMPSVPVPCVWIVRPPVPALRARVLVVLVEPMPIVCTAAPVPILMPWTEALLPIWIAEAPVPASMVTMLLVSELLPMFTAWMLLLLELLAMLTVEARADEPVEPMLTLLPDVST